MSTSSMTELTERAALDAGRAPEPIAIVGIGCRFPGADGPAAFWRLLLEGRDAVGEIPPGRWDLSHFYDEDPKAPGKMNTRWCGLLEEVDRFDPAFFRISPREAPQVDPQQRLLLEVAWEALEDAGLVPESLAGTPTGVFVGVTSGDYGLAAMSDPERINFYTVPGTSHCMTANRLSYFFDFRGPSLGVDTACSSSLVAVHMACASLWSGESELALAGGVNLVLSPEGTIWYSTGGLMARDGRCKAFDSRADGIVRGEGAGLVVLKRLSKALEDGDSVYAVISGCAVNQDGRSNGLTAPNRFAQEAVLRAAYRRAGVSPGEVQYVEAHGTGTALGDPIEALALGAVLSEGRKPGDLCALGSVKTNFGHLEAAAGIAGLIKVALMLRHRQLVPSLHFEKPNPHIPFETLPLRVQQSVAPWPEGGKPLLAGVTSCGFGGTNAHVVVGEAPSDAAGTQSPEAAGEHVENVPRLLAVSARTREALEAAAQAYVEHLSGAGAAVALRDLCYTAGVRRTHHDHRLAVVGQTHAELREALEATLRGETLPNVAAGRRLQTQPLKVAFVFPGQGSQWLGMARQLMREEPVFHASIERCEQELRKHVTWSLVEELTAEESVSRLDEVDVVQPIIFAVQVALTELWRSWGVEPDAVVGHSLGEVAAAYAAGALSLEDGARVICSRSKVVRGLCGLGGMVTVELSPEEARAALAGYEGRLGVAVHSSPISSVIAGESAALAELIERLEARGVFCRRINVDFASHGPQIEPLLDDLSAMLEGVSPRDPSVHLYSTVTGARADGMRLGADYWCRNLREPVLFREILESLLEDGYTTFVEISPHPVVLGSIRQTLHERGLKGHTLPTLRRGEDERAVMLSSLGRLYASGRAVNWGAICRDGHRVALPAYPWQRERFWLEEGGAGAAPRASLRPGSTGSPLLGAHLRTAHPAVEHVWEVRLAADSLPYLEDHRVQGSAVVPGAAFIEMVLEAVASVYGETRFELEDVEFRRALFLPEKGASLVQVTLSRTAEDGLGFGVHSRVEGEAASVEWALHAVGKILLDDAKTPSLQDAGRLAEAARARCTEETDAVAFYSQLAASGNFYGPSFQGITKLWKGEGEVVARLKAPAAVAASLVKHQFHPVLLDSGLQALGALLNADGACVPVGVERVRILGRPGVNLWVQAQLVDGGGATPRADVLLLDDEGCTLAELQGVRLRYLDAAAVADPAADWLYEPCWQERGGSAKEVSKSSRGGGRWLIFADAGGVGRSLATLLEAQGERCTLVFQELLCAPNSEASHEELRAHFAAAFPAGGGECRRIVYLWGLDCPDNESLTGATLDGSAGACRSALRVLQEMAAGEAGARLWVGSRGAQAVGEAEDVALAQAPLWGLGRTAAQEQPELWGGLIDLDPAANTPDCAASLLGEVASPDGEDQVAFRGGRRYVYRLMRAHKPVASARAPRFRPDGSYLITGGLGALALLTAKWMVEAGARRLVLLSRSDFPPRATWNGLRDDDPAVARVAAVRRLEAMGASVHVAVVDVSDEAQLGGFLNNFSAEGWPQIRGVVHCAGTLHDKTLLQLGAREFGATWGPKAAGGWWLHVLTANLPLDFFMLFSSAASLLGSAGQANYSAANAFLDALAQHRRARGQAALGINWGAWSEVGLAARADRGGRLSAQGFGSIAPEQGTELLSHLLQLGTAQVGVLPIDWPLARLKAPALTAQPVFTEVAAAMATDDSSNATVVQAPPGVTRELLLSAGSQERRRLLEEYLRELGAKVLRIKPSAFDIDKPLNMLGLDSLMAIELKNSIQSSIGVVLTMVTIMQGPSARELAEVLHGQLDGQAPAPDLTPDFASEAPAEGLGLGGLSPSEAEKLLSDLDGLDQEQIDQLLAELLHADD